MKFRMMGRACSMENWNGREDLHDADMYGMKVLEWVLKEQCLCVCVCVWTGLNWLKVGSSGGLPSTR
jgi:hypothetical protein